jgi:Enolase C-terminal domain-like
LWDLAGRAARLPVWQLLGATRDRLPVYYSGLFLGATLDELLAEAAPLTGLGYRAVKLRVGSPDPDEDVARVTAVRAVLAAGVRLLLDSGDPPGLRQGRQDRAERGIEPAQRRPHRRGGQGGPPGRGSIVARSSWVQLRSLGDGRVTGRRPGRR